MPNGPTYRYFTPEQIAAIPGIDVPMIPPQWIPKGYVQDFVESEGRWRVRQEKRRHYLPYFPVINFENSGEPVDFLL